MPHPEPIPAAPATPQTSNSTSAPAGATGRRRFLAQLAGLAAATKFGAPLTAGGAETPPAAAPMPTILLGRHRISRLVAGSNPISGSTS